jgi:hemerythrin superfamily protein
MSVKSTVRETTTAVQKALRPGADTDAQTDILTTLKKEHDEVKELLSRLQKSESGSERKNLVQQIKEALVPHTKAEEKVVYDAVIALRDKDARIDGHEGYLEHEWASKTLARLESIENATSPEHHATGKVLKDLVEHHIEEEESAIWNDVKGNFSPDQRQQMNRAFEAAKAKVRIH